jgi:hypothetical protein
MLLRHILAGAVLATLIAGGTLAAQNSATATEADQQKVMLTVYNSNMALVRDVRRVDVPSGQVELHFPGIAPQIEPETVQVVSLTAPEKFTVLEQNYRYDLLSPQTILQKYVGKELTLVERVMETNSIKNVHVKATLLSDTGGQVWKIGDQIVTGFPAYQYIFPSLPPGLTSKPTLNWLVENRASGPQTLETDYLTKSVNWTANYVLTLPPKEHAADLSAWITLDNQSGASFRNAHLQLVAGEVHRTAQEVRPMMYRMEAKAVAVGGAVPQVSEQALSEYHLYTLHRQVTLPDKESKQISLLAASGIKFDRTYEVHGQEFYYYSPLQGGQKLKQPVQTHIKFENSEANTLGKPLPAGVMRIYQSAADGSLALIGEDRIEHTPKDEKLDLYIGNAFDVAAERKQTDFENLGHNLYEAAFQITLRNHKTEPISVQVKEPLSGQWTILNSSCKYEKTSAFEATFAVPVPAGGESVLTYRVRVQR